jgi:hypothetical protein
MPFDLPHQLLKDRLVGEAVEEFFWSASDNAFRGNDILEPPKWIEENAGF